MEKQLQNEMVSYLESLGAHVLSVKSGKLMASYQGKKRMIHLAPTGTPDLYCIMNGIPFCIEVKKDEATARAWRNTVERYKESGTFPKSSQHTIDQYNKKLEIEAAGGRVFLCGSMEELKECIKEIRQ